MLVSASRTQNAKRVYREHHHVLNISKYPFDDHSCLQICVLEGFEYLHLIGCVFSGVIILSGT